MIKEHIYLVFGSLDQRSRSQGSIVLKQFSIRMPVCLLLISEKDANRSFRYNVFVAMLKWEFF